MTIAEKVAEVLEALVATRSGFEALDKEVHRMIETLGSEVRRTAEENRDLRDRVTKLEARFEAVLDRAVMTVADNNRQKIASGGEGKKIASGGKGN